MSIKRQITLLFLLSLVIMISLSLWIERNNRTKNEKIVRSHYLNLAKELLPLIVDNNQALLERKVLTLNLLSSPQLVGEVLLHRPLTFGEIDILKTAQGYGLKIVYLDEVYGFEDPSIDLFNQEQIIINALLLFNIFILLLIYLATIKIIAPIRQLSLGMKRFSKGEFALQVEPKGASEIRELSVSFNQMAKGLKEAIEERENLLKYIGHELKTPLAKSKFALEMDQPEIVRKSLLDMEALVNEILEMHLLGADNLKIRRFKAQTLITQALNRLYIEDESILEVDLEDFEIEGDLDHLAVALKNLIDNGIKYATELPIMLRANADRIEVISHGESLRQPLAFYLEAFTQEDPHALGHGLGLNIVKRVVEAHHFQFFYQHQEGKNSFGILFVANH